MSDWEIINADVMDGLASLPDNSVHCVVTSPPYFSLRDYGTAQWEGGSAECDHKQGTLVSPKSTLRLDGREHLGPYEGEKAVRDGMPFRDVCGKCGARRIDRQIGLEPTPQDFVQTMVRVFREVRRVLRADGTLWLNLGDSYAAGPGGDQGNTGQRANRTFTAKPMRKDNMGLPAKNLMMMPARVAIALQEDNWILRSDIIWAKRAPMPESVTDRPTTAHEHIFLLTKQPRYYFDQEAIREPAQYGFREQPKETWNRVGNGDKPPERVSGTTRGGDPSTGRNSWSYWLLSPEPFPAAHFATFPTEIPRRAILAGTSEHGVCARCGAPWRRVVERTQYTPEVVEVGVRNVDGSRGDKTRKLSGKEYNEQVRSETTGWQPTCTCNCPDVRPATVLDPFSGAGTTVLVANRLGRRGIGIELNSQYVAMSEQRIINDAPLLHWANEQEAIGA